MPRFDGTGPQGLGPMTGRGEGYCALVIPDSEQAPYGYAGVQGTPVCLGDPITRPAPGTRLARGPRMMGRGRGHGARRGRGRRFARR
jgi:hypothetical protein